MTMHDVSSVAVFRMETVCLQCDLQIGPTQDYKASQAKRHAMRHPGHVVVHRSVRETRYSLAPVGRTLPGEILTAVQQA